MNFRSVLMVVGLLAVGPLAAEMTTSIAKVKPSVVVVGTYSGTNSPRFGPRGTGFVVHEDQHENSNWVVTNAHVLQLPSAVVADDAWAVQLRVGPNELQMRTATVLEVDKLHDLVLLRFSGPAAPALSIGDSTTVTEGRSIAFMGFPIGAALGFSPVTHRGMISSIAAAALPTATAKQLNEKTILGLRDGSSFNIFQLDATAYPGNSGGPLFDPDTAEVLGVLNMVFIKGTRESALANPSGISYAIPSKFILDLLQRRRSH
jgi:S1-C subfamily serine protease